MDRDSVGEAESLRVRLDTAGTGRARATTGLAVLDDLLVLLAETARFDLSVESSLAGTEPEVEAIAHAAGVTPDELHHLFRRWAGLTPKAFLQAITLDHARRLLRDSASVLDASLEVGLSGPGRLHDLFVTHEAMSPGEWKSGGEGVTVGYGFHPSPPST